MVTVKVKLLPCSTEMLAGESHCHTLPSVKIFVSKWSDQGHLCVGQRTRGTNCWDLTTYVGSVLTGNNKQFFFNRSFIFSWVKQLLRNDFASDPCLPYPPGTFGKVPAHWLIPSFCHLYGYCVFLLGRCYLSPCHQSMVLGVTSCLCYGFIRARSCLVVLM